MARLEVVRAMQEWGVSPETIPGDGSNSICAEIWALRGSLRMALHIGLQFLIVELDAQNILYFESPPAEVISSLLADAMGISNPRDVCINAAYIAPG
ncbi:hypothetical protein CRG98_027862 [Punica granatum]|uniref:RNase H type-1 domain-containing protein n=1 Tax=Punica granatum TaxID=22663 RepID=A0A2I0J634_PUNGR|nr:hypothetical protein CRG98_027862 [Punica granatum]